MFCIIEYHSGRVVKSNIASRESAEIIKKELLEEKLKYSKDYTNYNWLLLIENQEEENQKKVDNLEILLSWPITQKLLKLELKGSWLSIDYQENLSFTPSEDGSKWSLLCAQDLNDETVSSLQNRVMLMLAENLRSARQDVNGLMKDEKRNEKKALIELAENLDDYDYNHVVNILKRNGLLVINK